MTITTDIVEFGAAYNRVVLYLDHEQDAPHIADGAS